MVFYIDILYNTHICIFTVLLLFVFMKLYINLLSRNLKTRGTKTQLGKPSTSSWHTFKHNYIKFTCTNIHLSHILVYSIAYSAVMAIKLFELRERDGQMFMSRRREMIQGRNAAEWHSWTERFVSLLCVEEGWTDGWMDGWMNGLFELLLHVATYGSRPPHSLLQMSCSIIITGQHDTTHTELHFKATFAMMACYYRPMETQFLW